jgi:hypothetical protein
MKVIINPESGKAAFINNMEKSIFIIRTKNFFLSSSAEGDILKCF